MFALRTGSQPTQESDIHGGINAEGSASWQQIARSCTFLLRPLSRPEGIIRRELEAHFRFSNGGASPMCLVSGVSQNRLRERPSVRRNSGRRTPANGLGTHYVRPPQFPRDREPDKRSADHHRSLPVRSASDLRCDTLFLLRSARSTSRA